MGTIDMSAATSAPPKRRTANTRAKLTVAPEPTPNKVNYREQGLNGLAQLGMGLCTVFGQYADAATIGSMFPPISHELAVIAETNESIAKPIDLMINVGPYGALLGVLMPFGLQIAANHGWIDASRLFGQGIQSPEVMEANMKAQMLEAAAHAKRAQNEALAKARAAQEEFEAAMRDAA